MLYLMHETLNGINPIKIEKRNAGQPGGEQLWKLFDTFIGRISADAKKQSMVTGLQSLLQEYKIIQMITKVPGYKDKLKLKDDDVHTLLTCAVFGMEKVGIDELGGRRTKRWCCSTRLCGLDMEAAVVAATGIVFFVT